MYEIPPAAKGDFEILVVGEAWFGVYIDQSRGSIQVKTDSQTLAKSICFDYIMAQLCRRDDAHPGLFWIPGTHTKEDIRVNYKKELEAAKAVQDRWFAALVQFADDSWSVEHLHKVISDSMRFAAKSLGLEREWLTPVPKDEPSAADCPVCGGTIKANIIICPHCSSILDEARYAKVKRAG